MKKLHITGFVSSFILYLFLISFHVLAQDKSISNALQFNGIDNYVSIPNGTGIIANLEAFSMCGWVYPSNANAVWPDLDGYFGIKNEGICDFYIVQLNGTDLEVRLTTNQGQFTIPSSSMPQIVPDEWQHFAIVYTGTELQLFYNGVLNGSVAASGTITYENLEVTIGKLEYFETDFFLNGKVDEVTFWDKALSADEIIENECITGDPSSVDNLIAYYNFNESEGLLLPDYFGNFDGTLTSMTGNEWVESAVCQSGYNIQFIVTDALSGDPLENASVDLDGVVKSTDINGEATFSNYDPGIYPFEITKSGYYLQNGDVTITENDTTVEIELAPVVYYDITFHVTSGPGGDPVDSALINLDGFIHYTNTSGQTTFTGYLPGAYPYAVFKEGYGMFEDSAIVLNENLMIEIPLIISEIPGISAPVFNIYPNPVKNKLFVEFAGTKSTEISLTLVNITGEIIASDLYKYQSQIKIDVSHIPAGIYFLKGETTDGVRIKKILFR